MAGYTFTSGSISSVSLVACTGEAPRSVGTCSIRVTVVSSIGTLINVQQNFILKMRNVLAISILNEKNWVMSLVGCKRLL